MMSTYLGGNHFNNCGITRLDKLRGLLDRLTSTPINLLDEFGELASNVGGVTVEDWGISVSDLPRVVHQDDLSIERLGTLWWVVLGVTSNVTTTNFLNRDVLDVESDVVTRETLSELLVMHFNGLHFSGNTSWGEGNDHTGLNDTGLNTTDWYSSNTTVVMLDGSSNEWQVIEHTRSCRHPGEEDGEACRMGEMGAR